METGNPDMKQPDSSIVIQRTLYTMSDLEERYKNQAEPKTCCNIMRDNCKCSGKCFGSALLKFIPIVGVLKNYKWKEYTVPDIVAGLSTAFVHLPQGLGYGILANMRAINGVYTGFFSVVPYMFFGSSPHISMGTNAVLALLTASLLQKQLTSHLAALPANTTMTTDEQLDFKVGVSAAACLLVGFILIAMGLLRLGFLTDYLSKSFISGFTFAAAIHIATSQVIKLLHLKLPTRSGPGVQIFTWIDIFKNIPKAVPGDIIVGTISLFVILGVRVGINERFRDRLKVPVPIELIVVIISTALSYLIKLNDNYGIAIVGPVPIGIPPPAIPNMSLMPNIGTDAFVMAILCFVLTIAVGKLCAKLYSFDKMDDNQELLAYGICNVVCGFFFSFPSSASPPRCMLLGSLGSKSILNNFAVSAFLLLILLVAGGLFEYLPIAMLAGMILVAMKDLLLQVRNLPSIWRVNKPDFFIWVVTAIVSVLGDLDIGLLAGAVFSMLTILFVSQLADGTLLGMSDSEDLIYISDERQGIHRVPGVRIFRFESQLFFASAERFKRQIYALVFNPTKKARKTKVIIVNNTAQDLEDGVGEMNGNVVHGGNGLANGGTVKLSKKAKKKMKKARKKKVVDDEKIHHLILDCSAMTYIDLAGIDMLLVTIKEYTRAGVEVFLACIPLNTLDTLHRANFFQTCDKSNVFFDLHDALRKATIPAQLDDELVIETELPDIPEGNDNEGYEDDDTDIHRHADKSNLDAVIIVRDNEDSNLHHVRFDAECQTVNIIPEKHNSSHEKSS